MLLFALPLLVPLLLQLILQFPPSPPPPYINILLQLHYHTHCHTYRDNNETITFAALQQLLQLQPLKLRIRIRKGEKAKEENKKTSLSAQNNSSYHTESKRGWVWLGMTLLSLAASQEGVRASCLAQVVATGCANYDDSVNYCIIETRHEINIDSI